MLSYVVVASKRGRGIPRRVFRSLDRANVPELFFSPQSNFAWENPEQTIAFFGWQSATDAGAIGSHWDATDSGLVAFSGHVWPRSGLWPQRSPWAGQLATYLKGRSPAMVNEELFGSYSIAQIGVGGGVVTSDPFGSTPLYRAENSRITAYSNRAILAARAVRGEGRKAGRDPVGAGWLGYFAHVVGNATAIDGVTALPTGQYIRLEPDGREHRESIPQSVWDGDAKVPASSEAWDEMVDVIMRDLMSHVEAAARLDTPRRMLRLSGGKDSRVVLALIVAAGLQDRFVGQTVGMAHAADVVVARRVAEAVGLDLNVSEPQTVRMTPEQFETRLRIHVFQTSGMHGAYDLKGNLGRSKNLVVSGLFGELMRSHYAKNASITSVGDVEAFFHNGLRFDAGAFVKEDATRHYESVVAGWLAERLAEGRRPESLPDVFYIAQRIRRWYGTAHELGGMNPHAVPLQTLVGTRAAFALGHRARQTDRLHFEIVRRASDRLAKMPLANQAWHPDVYGHLPDAEEYARIEPYTAEAGGGPQSWQTATWKSNLPVFRGYLSSRSNPIFEVLDFEKVQAALAKPRSLHARVQLFGALAAAVWLARDERGEQIES